MSPKRNLPSLGGSVWIQTELGHPEVRTDIYQDSRKTVASDRGQSIGKKGKSQREFGNLCFFRLHPKANVLHMLLVKWSFKCV